MDKRQKSTLRSLHINIADELILDNDFYAALRRDKIFTNGMLDIIKAEETPRNSVYKMLELLEKRGPEAFDNFVWILKENFQWLAKQLEEQYNRKLLRSQQGRERNEESHQTQLKHFSNDQYHRYNPKVSNHGAVFTPNNQQRASRHPIPSHEKQYKDACLSPIGILESPKKNEDVESQITSTPQVQSEGFETVSENIDEVDAPVHDDLDETDDDFPTSEAYYDCVRGGSSRLSHLADVRCHQEFKIQDDENKATRSEISYEQSEAFQNQMEEMRALYIKLNATTSENDTEDLEDDFVTWDMIFIETDKLINRLGNSDDTKMIRKCHGLFSEKERQQPLNVCIERLFADKKDLERRLEKKEKEEKQLFDDLLKQRGYMKKMEKTLADKEAENKNLKIFIDNLEKDAAIKYEQMEEKDVKIKKLERRLQELQTDQQKRPAAALRRGTANQRRVSNAQGQSPRRYSQIFGAYSQQSPRNLKTATRGTRSNKKMIYRTILEHTDITEVVLCLVQLCLIQ